MKKKKIPMRTCVITKEQHPKGEMFRIVRTNEGEVLVDETGKVRGRGAYLSKSKSVIEKARKRKLLDRHLDVAVPDSIYDELLKKLGDSLE
ncbi:MAG TPA: YlxR family protein [Acholeplasmataceae bacterium]|nr:YlxR family protein [Acholeplasmataceae bacterium]